MADNEVGVDYSILLARRGMECVASIPELCIAEKRPTPQEALAAALDAETQTRKTLQGRGEPLPPAGNRIDPFPGITRSAGKYFVLGKQVLVGYILVAFITAVLLALVFPSVRSRAEQYLNSKEIATDAKKIFSRLGVAVCSDAR